MVSFDGFRIEDGSPIYTQIVRHIKQSIVAGGVQMGEEMPSRRVLSALLGINPNTVQKAYRLLEEESIIESNAGAPSYIVANKEKVERIRAELLETHAQEMVGAMKKMAVSKEEAMSLIDKLWR